MHKSRTLVPLVETTLSASSVNRSILVIKFEPEAFLLIGDLIGIRRSFQCQSWKWKGSVTLGKCCERHAWRSTLAKRQWGTVDHISHSSNADGARGLEVATVDGNRDTTRHRVPVRGRHIQNPVSLWVQSTSISLVDAWCSILIL